jgi:hypothetical protein
MIDRRDLFKIINLVLDGEVMVTNLCSSLEEEEEEEERERRPVRHKEIMIDTVREERYVSEPRETKYLKFRLLSLLGSSGI